MGKIVFLRVPSENSPDAFNASSYRLKHKEPEPGEDKMPVFKVLEILCRLGMTETEAHNAIMQINDAGIKFTKE